MFKKLLNNSPKKAIPLFLVEFYLQSVRSDFWFLYLAIRYFIWVKIFSVYWKLLLREISFNFSSTTNCWDGFLYKPYVFKIWLLIQLFMNSKIFTIGKKRNHLYIIANSFTPWLTPFLNCFVIGCVYNRPSTGSFRIHISVDQLETFKLPDLQAFSTYWAKNLSPFICASWSKN